MLTTYKRFGVTGYRYTVIERKGWRIRCGTVFEHPKWYLGLAFPDLKDITLFEFRLIVFPTVQITMGVMGFGFGFLYRQLKKAPVNQEELDLWNKAERERR